MQLKQINRLAKFLLWLILGLAIALFNVTVLTAQPERELRGVWLTNIDSDVLFSEAKTAAAINKLSELNFNTLYPTVWNWGYTLYPSKVAKKETGTSLDPAAGLQGRDVLKEIIDRGHQKSMAVIPWFEFGFMAPADSALAKRHPDWLTQRSNGDKIWLEGNVHQRVWLNPLHPEVQQFIEDLVVEIVSNYDLDGIQFDDHFGYPSDFGYDELTLKLYRQEHGGKSPPSDPLDPEWIEWRANKITQYMERIFGAIKESKPKAIVSLSPNPQEFSLESFLLDWQKWERKGLVEELVLQVYRTRISDFCRELSQPEVEAARQHIPVAIGILAGLKGRPMPSSKIETQVEITRERDFAGVSFFFYESLWNLGEEPLTERQSSFQKLFSTALERPILSNK